MKKLNMLDLRSEYEYMKKDIDNAILNCMESQQWILGPEVGLLENKVAEYLMIKNCVGVASGTDALVLALRALAIKLTGKEYFDRSDKIITTPFTFTATGEAIFRSGATPVFIDIDPVTFNIDPNKIKDYLEMKPVRVIGIIPVHLYGLACDMDAITSISEKYNLFILEDVAQAFGGRWNDERLGTLGNAGAFSFFPSKNLGGFGDGGMVATKDDKIAELVRMLLKHGGKDKYDVEHIGYNSRLDTIQAAILLAKLKYVDEFNNKRGNIAKIYSRELSGVDGLIIPQAPEDGADCVYNQYTIRVLNNRRDSVQKVLNEAGISTAVYYPVPLDKMRVFVGKSEVPQELKEAKKASEEVLSLPIEPLLSEEEITYVCINLKKAC